MIVNALIITDHAPPPPPPPPLFVHQIAQFALIIAGVVNVNFQATSIYIHAHHLHPSH